MSTRGLLVALAVGMVWFQMALAEFANFYFRGYRDDCAAAGGVTVSHRGNHPTCFAKDAVIKLVNWGE